MIIPDDIGIKISYKDVNSMDFIDNFIKDAPFEFKIVIRILFVVLEIASIFFYLKPFSSLPLEKKLNFIHKWEVNKLYFIRGGLKLMLFIGYLSYYSHPKIYKQLNYNLNFEYDK